jgi:hypothetical protein
MQMMFGMMMLVVGGIKTWLHMGTVPILSLPTCNGKTLEIAVGGSSWFEQAHCWGCYMFAAGLGVISFVAYQQLQKRRSVALRTD